MKTLKLFTLLVLALVLFAEVPAQSWTKNAKQTPLSNGALLAFELTLDTNNTYQSEAFSLNRFDNDSFSTYPLGVEYYNVSAVGAVQVTTILQYSYDGTNFTNKDTIISASTSETRTATTLTPTVKAPYYRINFVGGTNNRSDTAAKLYLYAYRKDVE